MTANKIQNKYNGIVPSPKAYKGLAWIAAMAFFMQTLDATILNTALPAISHSLNESPLNMQLAVIAYAVSVALFIPLSGWLADNYGSLKVFRISVGIFILGSIACALSISLDMLIFSRILQGMGGALMMPVVRLTMIQTIPKKQLISAWNLAAIAGLLGPILGPILGGWLVTYATWHWIFLINIPIGIIGIIASKLYMPNLTDNIFKLDWYGFLLFAGGLVGITLGLDLVAEGMSELAIAIVLLVLGSLFLCAYVAHAKKTDKPLLSLKVFKIRTYRLGLMVNLFIRLCASSVPFLIPLMFQIVFGYSAEIVGWLLAPIAISSIIAKPIVTPLLKLFGYKRTLIISSFMIMLVVAMMGFLNAQTPLIAIIVLFCCYGVCMSILFTSINTLTISELDNGLASAGSTLLSVTQQVGIGIGIAVSAMLLNVYRHLLEDKVFIVNNELLQQAFSYTFFTTSLFGIYLLLTLRKLEHQDGNNLI